VATNPLNRILLPNLLCFLFGKPKWAFTKNFTNDYSKLFQKQKIQSNTKNQKSLVVFYILTEHGIDIIGIPHKSMDVLNYFNPD